jgi:hypothetical protein
VFLKFLEAKYPGIVKKLYTAQYDGTYTDNLFKTITGKTVDQLWQTYVQAGSSGRKRRGIDLEAEVDEEPKKVYV